MGELNTFINGEFTTAEKAVLPIEDRGMLFGDGVYDFTRCYIDGVPFQLEVYLERLSKSAAAIDLELPYTREEIKAIITELLEKSGTKQAGIYMQATRGCTAPRDHAFPQVVKPTFFIIARELEPEPPEIMTAGMKAILVPDQRWGRCDIKSLNLLPNIMAKEKAAQQGAYEAILYRDYGVTEGSSTSVFAVFDGTLYTTPPGNWVLPSVTKRTLLKLGKDIGHPPEYKFIPKDEIYKADEVFTASSRFNVVPITRIDEEIIGSGKPGPITCELKKAFVRFATT